MNLNLTPLEYTLIAMLWFVLGLFICGKRNWYTGYEDNSVGTDFNIFVCCVAVTFMPLNLLIVFIRVFFIDAWKND